MKKRFATLVVLSIVAPLLTFSQLRIALTGGPHGASVKEKNNLPGWDSTSKPGYSGRTAFHIGFQVEIPLEYTQKWHLHPAIQYQPKGRKFFQRYDTITAHITDTLSSNTNFSANYIEIPINITRKFQLGKKSKFLVSAGPYLAFFYNGQQGSETRLYSNNKFIKEEDDIEVGKAPLKVKTVDIGFNARAGFELGNILLTGFFSQGLTNFYTAPYKAEFNHRIIGASLGFWLNKAPVLERKPKDKDKDGIEDKEDVCPTIPGTALTRGCPDRDGDGIEDLTDQCPDIAGTSRYMGCPVPDTDNDGINDDEDKCPNTAGTMKYNGCPVPDSDGDGMNDESDACPDKAGIVEFNGCPIPDSDQDGLNDLEDKCPDQPGTRENHGCPEVQITIEEQVNFAARNIFFTLSSDKLTTLSFEALDVVVDVLKNNPALKLEIAGHTDSTGNAGLNLLLSQKRADAVKAYLVSKGIEGERLYAIGYGQEKALTENNNPEGRARNRRVELRLKQD